MTTTTEAPKMFIQGTGDVYGYRGLVVFQGRTHTVLHKGQWAFDRRADAVVATRRFAKSLTEWTREMAKHRAVWAA